MTARNLRFALLSIVVVAAGIAIAITVRKRFAAAGHDDPRAATASDDRTGPRGATGPGGSATLEVLLTPEQTPTIQTLTVATDPTA